MCYTTLLNCFHWNTRNNVFKVLNCIYRQTDTHICVIYISVKMYLLLYSVHEEKWMYSEQAVVVHAMVILALESQITEKTCCHHSTLYVFFIFYIHQAIDSGLPVNKIVQSCQLLAISDSSIYHKLGVGKGIWT